MKIIVENFTLKHFLLSEICTHELCEKLHAPISMAVRKRRVTFLICLRKRGIPRKEGGRGGNSLRERADHGFNSCLPLKHDNKEALVNNFCFSWFIRHIF